MLSWPIEALAPLRVALNAAALGALELVDVSVPKDVFGTMSAPPTPKIKSPAFCAKAELAPATNNDATAYLIIVFKIYTPL